VAEGKRVAELDAELKTLTKYWEEAIEKVQKSQKRPHLVFEETSRAVALLRDLFNPTYENIYVNDEDVFKEVKHYVSMIAPDKVDIVKLYSGKVPIFDNFNITKQIKSSFGKTINAYLFICFLGITMNYIYLSTVSLFWVSMTLLAFALMFLEKPRKRR